MALDDLPGLGAIGSAGAVAGDLLLNSGEILISLVAVLLSSPDLWVSIVLYGQRLAEMFGFGTAWLEPLVAIGTMLLIMMYAKRLIERWRDSQ